MSRNIIINTNCKNRIKPNLLRDMKTEAVLVFTRTALERFFKRSKDTEIIKIGSLEDTKYIYENLWNLKLKLQDSVVNVEYLINLVQSAKKNPDLNTLVKFEEPLIRYYDAMSKRIEFHIPKSRIFIPEFLVLCILNYWIVEEEKSIKLYPFLKEFDFLNLIEKFELEALKSKEDRKNILDAHRITSDLIETLKKTKYKYNIDRISKIRKK